MERCRLSTSSQIMSIPVIPMFPFRCSVELKKRFKPRRTRRNTKLRIVFSFEFSVFRLVGRLLLKTINSELFSLCVSSWLKSFFKSDNLASITSEHSRDNNISMQEDHHGKYSACSATNRQPESYFGQFSIKRRFQLFLI